MRQLTLTLLFCVIAASLSAQSATLVKDINTSGEVSSDLSSSSPSALTAVAGKVFFLANEPSTGGELWVSDGSAAGTYPLHGAEAPSVSVAELYPASGGWTRAILDPDDRRGQPLGL